MKFKDSKVGDEVVRWLAGEIEQRLKVTEVKEDRLVCALWEFDKRTGAEIDEDLDWGPPPKMTGSFITFPNEVPPNVAAKRKVN